MVVNRIAGYKGHQEGNNPNGLFAEDHPSWTKQSALQHALEGTLKAKNPYLGVITAPLGDSVGE